MATSIGSVLLSLRHESTLLSSKLSSMRLGRNASWTNIFKGKKDTSDEDATAVIRKPKRDDGPSTDSRLSSLKKKQMLVTVRGYSPPANVDTRVAAAAQAIVGSAVEPHYDLSDRDVKFKLLTCLMSELDHVIPSNELNNLKTVEDVVIFFSTPVKDTSSYEDMAKLDLPPNLHIQMDAVRFDAETDTFFGGQTAFPGRPTVVSSLKQRHKYKGNQGESRNERSLTKFEIQKSR